MDSAVVDFNGRCFPHCHYVSLSRVKKMESRFTRDLNEKNIHVDATVVEEMQRLQKNMKLITSFKVLSEPSNYFSLFIIKMFDLLTSITVEIAVGDINIDGN